MLASSGTLTVLLPSSFWRTSAASSGVEPPPAAPISACSAASALAKPRERRYAITDAAVSGASVAVAPAPSDSAGAASFFFAPLMLVDRPVRSGGGSSSQIT